MKSFIFCTCLLLLVSCNGEIKNNDELNLESKLSGKWIAEAFDGELHENWQLGDDGWMLQKGYYIEKADTSYSAQTRIEKVNNELILFSVIKNSTPKIFQAIEQSNNKIVFENRDYRNPYKVTYEFFDSNKYVRTIEGLENDSLVIYTFDFKKQ